MKTLREVCDLCEEQRDTHRYGSQDVCAMCKLDIDQLMQIMRRIHVHQLWPKYHTTLNPLLWKERWLPDTVTA